MRKVKFRLQEIPESMQDESNENEWKERNGIFHEWGFDCIFIPVTENAPEANIQVSRAIIEDTETKQVHLVYPEYVTFLE